MSSPRNVERPEGSPSERAFVGLSRSRQGARQGGKYEGKRLGKFRIVGELGRGGMGVVLEARDTVLDRGVAIKLLPRSVAAQPDALQRFLREAQAAAKLHHPHVVGVYEADQINGQYYIVLELVRGGNMQEVLRAGALSWAEATRVVADACRGLAVAHQAGLVHRDIKPANLMRAVDGTVKVADFGLARAIEAGVSMTGSGQVLGTPQFMSPEQCRSEIADARSDVYSMGATYFTLLTGRVPFPGDAPLLVMNAHLLDPVPRPRDVDPRIPEECGAVIRRAMAKNPDDRYADAQELLAALETLLPKANTEFHEPPGTSLAIRPGTQLAAVDNEHRDDVAAAVSFAPRTRGLTVESTNLDLSWGVAQPESERQLAVNTPQKMVSLLLPGPVRRRPRVFAASAGGVVLVVMALLWRSNGWFGNAPALSPTSPPSVADPAGAFSLPGLQRDSVRPGVPHESWSVDYPGISHLAMASSGEFLAVLTNVRSLPGRVNVWSREGKRLLDEPLPNRATCLAISPNGEWLAAGSASNAGVSLWNTNTWRRAAVVLPAPGADVDAVAFSRDSLHVAYCTNAVATTTASRSAWVLWDLAKMREIGRSSATSISRMRAIAFAPENELTLLTGHDDGAVRLWSPVADSDREVKIFRVGVAVTAIDTTPHNHLMAIGAGKYFAIWSYRRDRRDFATMSPASHTAAVMFSPSGSEVCWASGGTVQCADSASRQTTAMIPTSGAAVLSLAYVPQDKSLFAAMENGMLVLWRIKR